MKRKKEFIWDTGWTMTLFGKLVQGVSGKFPVPPDSAGETAEPAMDIFEEKDAVVVEVEAPGMGPDDFNVFIADGRLKIEGFKKGGADRDCVAYLCLERQYGVFRRVVPIPGSFNTSAVRAFLVNGILRITIPRVLERRKTAVEVPIVQSPSPSGEEDR